MESTEIPASKTCGEIERSLVDAGARGISKDYSSAGEIVALTFSIPTESGVIAFALPVRTGAVEKILLERRASSTVKSPRIRKSIRARAEMIAWRHVLRWVQAQAAMIETGQASAVEIFLPFALVGNSGRRVYDVLSDRGILALPPAPDQETPE
jgi:hypothetical protein